MFSEATLQFINRYHSEDVRQLALKYGVKGPPDVDLAAALTQIAGRQAVEHKIPSWHSTAGLVYPPPLSVEQCSSEMTARYKSTLFSGRSFADLTGGFGVDTAFISSRFELAYYVERQAGLCETARHNFQQLGLNHVRVFNEDALSFLMQMTPVDCLFLDPARRSVTGKKLISIADCEPDVSAVKDLLLEKSGCVCVKLSPMLDIASAFRSLPETSEVHVVSVENECKELLFLMKKGWEGDPLVTCINFPSKGQPQSFVFRKEEEKYVRTAYTSELKKYLYEPNVSLLKAGAYKTVAFRYGLQKLHPDSHLYTSDGLLPDFPGRVFEILSVSSLNKKEMKGVLSGLDRAHISVRNFPLSVDEIRKKMKLKDGGSFYLFATTLVGGKKVILYTQKPKS